MSSTRRTAMLTDPVGKTLTNLTIPTIFGLFGMVAFNLADTFFVGQLGTKQLAAMSFTFPVVMVVLSIAFGIGQGGAVLVARAIGEDDQVKVRRITTDLILLDLLVVIVLSGVGILTVEPLFAALGAPPDVLALIGEYMFIWYIMILFVLVPMTVNLVIRATGDAKTPSVIMMVAVAVNIALDPLLIFGWGPIPRLELVGAASATAISRAVTLVYAVYVIHVRENMLTFTWPGMAALFASWRQILAIGVPAAATNMITPLSMGLITRLVATYGVAAVAAFGVASRIDMLALVVIMALGNVMTPFVGQNWGAAKYERVREGIRLSQRFAMAWGLLMVILLVMPGRWLAGLFNDDPHVVDNVVLYLWMVPLSYGIQGLFRLASFTLNVLNKPLYSMLLTLLQMFGLYIPLAYAGSYLLGLAGIFGAGAVAHFMAGGIAYWVLWKTVMAEEKKKVVLLSAVGVSAD